MYELTWRNKFLTIGAKSIDDMIRSFTIAVNELQAMKEAGVVLDADSGIDDDYARLVTTSEEVARKFGFSEEFWV